jgi:hypothetical protein
MESDGRGGGGREGSYFLKPYTLLGCCQHRPHKCCEVHSTFIIHDTATGSKWIQSCYCFHGGVGVNTTNYAVFLAGMLCYVLQHFPNQLSLNLLAIKYRYFCCWQWLWIEILMAHILYKNINFPSIYFCKRNYMFMTSAAVHCTCCRFEIGLHLHARCIKSLIAFWKALVLMDAVSASGRSSDHAPKFDRDVFPTIPEQDS